MTRRQYKITRCNILQKDFQSSQHDVQCNVTPRRISSSKSVEPYAHYRRKLYIGLGLHCAIYIILSLGFSGAGIFFLPMSVRPGVCFRGIGRESVEN
jgi:hypothetical protein